jgi:hypothetical protein
MGVFGCKMAGTRRYGLLGHEAIWGRPRTYESIRSLLRCVLCKGQELPTASINGPITGWDSDRP